MGKSKVKPTIEVTQRAVNVGKSGGKLTQVKGAPLPLRGESCGASFSVTRCANLRRDASTGNLLAAGLPVSNSNLSSLPLLVMKGDVATGRMAIVASGSRLRLEYIDSDASGYDIGGVAGRVTDIVMLRADRGVVMTDTARYNLVCGSDGKWRVRDGRQFPALQFEAVDVMRLSADTEERALTGEYDTRSTALNDADADRLGKDLLRCYRELVDKTVRSGLELQPLLARYRLEGEGGEVLYRSPVVQVGAPSGVQCVSELHCELSADSRSRGVLRVAADVYRLRLRQTGSSTAEPGIVRRLVVETSLPVHPVDASVSAANALSRSGTNGVMLRCFLPGASVTMTSSRRRPVEQLRGMAMKGDAAFRDVLTVHNPFDGEGMVDVTVGVARADVQGLDGEMEAVARALRTDVERVPAMVAQCRVPNSFVAAAGCVAGDNAVWGDVKGMPFAGYRVEELAVATTPDGVTMPWRAVVVTQLASGCRCVATSWGQQHAPLKLSPVLCFPRPDAVEMTVVIERGGSVYKGVYPLSPDEAGTTSYYCDEGGMPVELAETEEVFAYVTDTRIAERFPSGLLVSDISNPFDAGRCDTAGRGTTVALAAVDRRGSSWEFGRQRVYAFTTGGIYLLSIAGGSYGLRCNRLDRRAVTAATAVAETDDDRYPMVCIAGGDLMGLSRGNAVTLEEGIAESIVGWDIANKELWLADSTGAARVKESVDGGWRDVAGIAVEGFGDTADGLLVAADIGILDTACGEETTAETAYTLRCDMPALDWYRAGMRVSGAGAQMRSPNLNGELGVVSRDVDAGEARMASRIAFRGSVNTPLTMALRGCTGPVVDVTVSGAMDAGSELREVRLLFK